MSGAGADGVLDLDTDIHEYLTSWRLLAGEGWRPSVTLRQLLAHTAGLSYNWFRGYGVDEPIPSLVQTLQGDAPANTPPVRSSLLPGSRFRYSGSHYAVLQQLMVDATGSRFDELMHALVLEPVAMADSSFDQQFPHQRPQLVALGHHVAGTPVSGGWRTIPEMAGAGLWSTPTDLLRLDLEVARAATGKSQLLDQDLATHMLTPQLPDGAYGLGTEIDDSTGHRRFGHTGGNVGYNCFSFAWPDANVRRLHRDPQGDHRSVGPPRPRQGLGRKRRRRLAPVTREGISSRSTCGRTAVEGLLRCHQRPLLVGVVASQGGGRHDVMGAVRWLDRQRQIRPKLP